MDSVDAVNSSDRHEVDMKTLTRVVTNTTNAHIAAGCWLFIPVATSTGCVTPAQHASVTAPHEVGLSASCTPADYIATALHFL